MNGDNLYVSREMEILERSVQRLEERFRLEREGALEDGSRDALLHLRDRSKLFFSPEIERMARELARLSASVDGAGAYAEEVRTAAAKVGRLIARLRARFVGTPHRLLRNADLVQRVHDRGGYSGDRRSEAAHDDEEDDLQLTDPPVECPICGEILMRDGDFTLLYCPGCGATEDL